MLKLKRAFDLTLLTDEQKAKVKRYLLVSLCTYLPFSFLLVSLFGTDGIILSLNWAVAVIAMAGHFVQSRERECLSRETLDYLDAR